MIAPFVVNSWADLVFHVLSHVSDTASLAPSVYDLSYVDEVAKAVGPASERALAEDAKNLGRVLTTHESLAQSQLLAWLFHSVERAKRCADRDLAQLTRDDVDRPELLAPLVRLGAPVEVLRAAAELEQPAHARLPAPKVDLHLLTLALAEATEIAPHLASCKVGVSRALRLRGRVLGNEIWIGLASYDHMAWQASHEATVSEVVEARKARGLPFDHDEVEREAVGQMAERAANAGRQAEHRRWLSQFRVP
jgi:hypothetical protein